MSTPAMPHILVLTLDDEFDPDCPKFWTDAELTCPYEPSELMPCAMWTPCGCEPVAYEQDNGYFEGLRSDHSWIDPLVGHPGLGPCPRSALGYHAYWEGDPCRPSDECWPTKHAEIDDVDEAARDLHLGPGRYAVRPWCDDETLRLEFQAELPGGAE